MKRVQFMRIFGYCSLALTAMFVVIILYWLLSVPEKALVVSKEPIPVETKTVSPNGFVVLNISACKQVSAAGRVTISVVSDFVQLALPTGYESGPKGCTKNTRAPLPVPPQATPGKYHYHFRATYQINPLKTIVQDYDTEKFIVK